MRPSAFCCADSGKAAADETSALLYDVQQLLHEQADSGNAYPAA